MSERVEPPTEFPVPLPVFARELQPRAEPHPVTGKPQLVAGHADEVWLKLLRVNHGNEKHTLAEWRALIDNYRGEPAHPTVLGI